MGNQQIRDGLQVRNNELTDADFSLLETALWSDEDPLKALEKLRESHHELDVCLDRQYQRFGLGSTPKTVLNEEETAQEGRRQQMYQALQRMSLTFSTSEKKLNDLVVQGDFKHNLMFTSDAMADKFIKWQHYRQAILVILHLARTKGGGKKVRQTLLDYFREATTDADCAMNDQEMCAIGKLQLKLGAIFNPQQLLVLKDLQQPELRGLYYFLLRRQILELLGAWQTITKLDPYDYDRAQSYYTSEYYIHQRKLGKRQQKVFEMDAMLMPLQDVLVRALQDADCDHDCKVLALRLLAKMAIFTRNAENFLVVSYFQRLLQVDVTCELAPLLDEKEQFVKADDGEDHLDFDTLRYRKLKNNVEFHQVAPAPQLGSASQTGAATVHAASAGDDGNNQVTIVEDAFAVDNDHFYNYSEFRGFTKAKKGSRGDWQKVVALNPVLGLQDVSMVVFRGMLLVRHRGQPEDVPFQQYDKETLKPVEESKFCHETGDENKLKRMDWSENSLNQSAQPSEPATEAGAAEVPDQPPVSEAEQNANFANEGPAQGDPDSHAENQVQRSASQQSGRDGLQDGKVRAIGATALCSDGDFIYALSWHKTLNKNLQSNGDGGDDSEQEFRDVILERYQVDEETKTVRQVGAFTLRAPDGDPFEAAYNQRFIQGERQYLNFVQTACDRQIFIMNFPQRTFFFKLNEESPDQCKVLHQSKLRSFSAHYQLVHDLDADHALYCFQIGCHQGFQKKLTIEGFPWTQASRNKLKKAPLVLTEVKEDMKSEIKAEAQENVHKPKKPNIYDQLLKGRIDNSSMVAVAKLNLESRPASRILHNEVGAIGAIILTTMVAKGEEIDAKLDKLGQNMVVGSELLKYFRHDYCVYLTVTYFKFLELSAKSLATDFQGGESTDTVNLYSLASLSSVLRLIRLNLRCMSICKISLDQIFESAAQLESFAELRNIFGSEFRDSLKAAVEAKVSKATQELEEEDKKSSNDDEAAKTLSAKRKQYVADLEKYGEYLAEQASQLEKVLSLLFHSTNPAQRMAELAQNLLTATSPSKAQTDSQIQSHDSQDQEGEKRAARHRCLMTFEALSNDSSLRDILQTCTSAQFEHLTSVVNLCIQLSVKREQPSYQQPQESSEADDLKLQTCAATFLKLYVRQHCAVYSDLVLERSDKDKNARSEEGTNEEKEEIATLSAQMEILRAPLLSFFQRLCSAFAGMLKEMQRCIEEKSVDRVVQKLGDISQAYEGEFNGTHANFLHKNVLIILWYLNFNEVESDRMDDVAGGLRTLLDATIAFVNAIDSLDIEVLQKAKDQPIYTLVSQVQRQACYHLGLVAHKLIVCKEEAKDESESEPAKKVVAVDLAKHKIIQGGLETRFIPTFAKKNKSTIRSFSCISPEFQKLATLSEAGAVDVSPTEDDRTLQRILGPLDVSNSDADQNFLQSFDGTDSVELTIQVLQRAACKRRGGLLMSVGGADGMRLTRAVFAVMVKFRALINVFTEVQDSVELYNAACDDPLSTEQRCDQICHQLLDRNDPAAGAFEELCRQWEQAAQIRRWTQEMKKDLTESLISQITDQLIAEINEQMAKQAELKTSSQAHLESVEIALDKGIDANARSDLEEEKNADQQSDKDKDEGEDANEVTSRKQSAMKDEVTGEMKESEGTDGLLFNGILNNDQKAEVEERAYQRMQVKIREAIEDSIKKASLLLKMNSPVPSQRNAAQGDTSLVQEGLQEQTLARKLSVNVQSSSKGKVNDISEHFQQPLPLNKHSSIVDEQSQRQQAATSAEWQKSMAQWLLTQQTRSGAAHQRDTAVVATEEEFMYKQIPSLVIALMQSKVTAESIQVEVEKAMVSGLQRSAGLKLLNFAIQRSIHLRNFRQLLQWFCSSLRKGSGQATHYTDDVVGCGAPIIAEIRHEFFLIIESILNQIKIVGQDTRQLLIHFIQALFWDYRGQDFDFLARLDLIEILHRGDGDKLHPIRSAWGKSCLQMKDPKNLSTKVINLFEFVFKQILGQVASADAQTGAQTAFSVVSLEVQRKLLKQCFAVVFDNLDRYVALIDEFFPSQDLSQSSSTDPEVPLADEKAHIDEQGGQVAMKNKAKREYILRVQKFNMLTRKVKETTELGYLVKVYTLVADDGVVKVKPSLSGPQLQQFKEKLLARDIGIKLALRSVDFESLQLEQPTEQKIENALREVPKLKNDNSFELNYSRLKDIYKGLEQMLQDGNLSKHQFKFVYKKFYRALPGAWPILLRDKETERFWHDGGNYEKEVFKDASQCMGLSEYQICLSNEQALLEESKQEVAATAPRGQAVNSASIELRFKRKDVCKNCFWFGVLLRVLRQAPEVFKTESLYLIIKRLPSSCEVISNEPQSLINSWLSEAAKSEELLDTSDQDLTLYSNERFPLLSNPSQKRLQLEAKASQSHFSQEAQEPQLTVMHDLDSLLLARLQNLRQRQSGDKVEVMSLKHMYNEEFLLRICGLLNLFTSLALQAPSCLAFMHEVADPARILTLLSLLASSSLKCKTPIIRSFQDLMKLDVPIEVLDSALQVVKSDTSSTNTLAGKIKQLLAHQTCLDLGNIPFLKVLYSMILEIHETTWLSSKQVGGKNAQIVGIELSRVFQTLFQSGERNIFIQKVVQGKIKEALLKVEQFPEHEMEALMSLMNESASNQLHYGTICTNQANQVFTVIGFMDKSLDEVKDKPELLDSMAMVFDPASQNKFVYGLFFDVNSPQRQEIIDCQIRKAKLMGQIFDETSAAKNSPFFLPEVVQHFMAILEGTHSCRDAFAQTLLCNHIVRGMNKMVQMLQSRYLQFLSQLNLSKSFLAYILAGASTQQLQQSHQKLSQLAKTTYMHSSIKLDQMRLMALTSDNTIRNTPVKKLYFSQSLKQCFLMQQLSSEGSKVLFHRLAISKFIGFSEKELSSLKFSTVVALAQINVTESLADVKHKIVAVNSETLHRLPSNIADQQILKCSQLVLTDAKFNLKSYVELVESLAEQNTSMYALARIKFIIVPTRAFQDLESVILNSSQSSTLTAPAAASSSRASANGTVQIDTGGESSGLEQDALTDEISNLTSAGVKLVWIYIKHLIDLKRDEFQSAHEQIKQCVTEHLCKKATEEQASKLQQDIEDQFAYQQAETDSQAKEAGIDAEQVDESDGASKVQSVLNLSTDLKEHLVSFFEKADKQVQSQAESVGEAELLQNFVDATAVPKRQGSLHQLYASEAAALLNLLCRDTFFNLIAFGYKSYASISNDLEMSASIFSQLQSLVVAELSAIFAQSAHGQDKSMMKMCKNKVKSLYTLFFSNDRQFSLFAVRDILERGIEVIRKVREADSETNLDELEVQELMKRNAKLSDPLALAFLASQLVSMRKVSLEAEGALFVDLVEVVLSFAVIFAADESSKVSVAMLQTCANMIQHQRELVKGSQLSPTVLTRLLNNRILHWICTNLDFEVPKLNQLKKLLIQIATSLFEYQGLISQSSPDKRIEVAPRMNKFIAKFAKQKAVFEDGRSFKYLIHRLQLRHILQSEHDCNKVRDIVQVYQTDKNMFKTLYEFTIKSQQTPLKINFNKIQTTHRIKLTPSDGEKPEAEFSAEQKRKGVKSYILDSNSEVKVDIVPGDQFVHLNVADLPLEEQKNNYIARIRELELDIVEVICVQTHLTIVCSDGSVYAIKQSVQNSNNDYYYNEPGEPKPEDESNNKCIKLETPHGCTNYLKVVASATNRLILTKTGLLFCQGENLRSYIDKKVKAGDQVAGFIDCTDVFPIDEGDQIIDVAAGKHYTVVVTENGQAYAVGFAQQRLRQMQLDEGQNPNPYVRQPAYKIEFKDPGCKAVACWANPSAANAYIQVETVSGPTTETKIYSGCEFVSNCNLENTSLLGWDASAEAELKSKPSGSSRPNYQEVKFPKQAAAVHIKKICNIGQDLALAVDSSGCLYTWGSTLGRESVNVAGREEKYLSTSYEHPSIVCKLDWFEQNEVKIVDLCSSEAYSLLKGTIKGGRLSVFAFINTEQSSRVIYNFFKKESEELLHNVLYRLKSIDATDCISFSCSSLISMLINNRVRPVTSFTPKLLEERAPALSGLTHVYKDDTEWKFIDEASFQEHKSSLPDLCFAFCQPVADFDAKSKLLPDLMTMFERVRATGADSESQDKQKITVVQTLTNEPFPLGEPLYCSMSTISGRIRPIFLTQDQFFGRQETSALMNPLVFYRVKDWQQNLELHRLTEVDLASLYRQSGCDEEHIQFSVKSIGINSGFTMDLNTLISDMQTRTDFANLLKLTPSVDRQLIRLIDKYFSEMSFDENTDKTTLLNKMDDFNFEELDWKSKPNLKSLPEGLIQMRTELLLMFTKQFLNCSQELLDLSGKVKPGSLPYFFLKNKNLALNCFKDDLLMKKIQQLDATPVQDAGMPQGYQMNADDDDYYGMAGMETSYVPAAMPRGVKKKKKGKKRKKKKKKGMRYRDYDYYRPDQQSYGNFFGQQTTSITINRNKASVFATDGKVDHDGTQTVFGQVFQQCKKYDANYRNFRADNNGARCVYVNFVGEASIDAGGPFRDMIDNIAAELESSVLPLLIKTPNNQNDHGSNRDCYMINPSSRTPTHLEMFKFFGALLSFSIMSKAPIPLHLAPTVWKQLLGEQLDDLSDFESFDAFSSQVLVDLLEQGSKISDDEFDQRFKLNFETILSNGEEVNLLPGEDAVGVTRDYVNEYVKLVKQARFNESSEQIEAMRAGIKMVFTEPAMDILKLMDWEHVEARACGQKYIEIDKLKEITEYSCCNENSPIIKRFWRVMASFDNELRQAYLKFVWGRSRLPIDTNNMSQRHRISLCSSMDKTSLPQAHTCFFSIDMPEYESDKMMRDKLLIAITLCGDIDTDGTADYDFNGDVIRR